MNIHTCEKCDLEYLTLNKPVKVEDVYVSNIDFALQTTKISIHKILKKVTVFLDDKMEKLLKRI